MWQSQIKGITFLDLELKLSTRINMDKVFNDSIHGHMNLPKICVAIIDTPQFQRLRNLKQLGTGYLVYPGASHNRFEHSLGVCHLAGLFMEKLIQNRRPDAPEITAQDKLCVQIAGLCHDLGHGPYSHTWEAFVNPVQVKRKDKKWEHEVSSTKMFDYLLKENPNVVAQLKELGINRDELGLIKDLILGKRYKENTHPKPFLFQIVANKDNDIDVDKMQYLLLDGIRLNVPTFDYNRLLNTVRLCRVPQDGNNWHVCYRDKDGLSIWDMFQTRAKLHYSCYQHNVVTSLEFMLIDALTLADEAGFSVPMPDGTKVLLSKTQDNEECWERVTDHIIQDILYSLEPQFQSARDLLLRMFTRDIYQLLHTSNIKDVTAATAKEERVKKFCAEDNKFKYSDFRFNVRRLNLGQGQDNPFKFIYLYNKRNCDIAESKPFENIPLFSVNKVHRSDLRVYYTASSKQKQQKNLDDILDLLK